MEVEDDDAEFEPSDDEVVTIPCPHCRKEIWEESVACEHCGRFLTAEDAPRRRPWWWIIGGVACLLCVWFWLRR